MPELPHRSSSEPSWRLIQAKAENVVYFGAIAAELGWPENVKWDDATIKVTAPVEQTSGYVVQEGEIPLRMFVGLLLAAIRTELRVVGEGEDA